VFEKELRQMRECVLRGHIIISEHALQRMLERRLGINDVERTIRTGRIIKRQTDEITGKLKYIVRGQPYALFYVELVTKFTPSKWLKVLTVYRV
jgi:hypothetical protein